MKTIIRLPYSVGAKLQISPGALIKKNTPLATLPCLEHIEEKSIHAARLLHTKPAVIGRYLKIKQGAQVHEGEVIAVRKSLLAKYVIRSPIEGSFKEIDLRTGILILKQTSKSLPSYLISPVAGRVVGISESCIEIEVNGTQMKALEGKGDDVSGTLIYIPGSSIGSLDLKSEVEGSIILCKDISSDALIKLEVLGAKGVISTGKIFSSDLSILQVDPKSFDLLTAFFGHLVWLRIQDKEIIIFEK